MQVIELEIRKKFSIEEYSLRFNLDEVVWLGTEFKKKRRLLKLVVLKA